ncbi:uncharacterized protein [Panulirus ornatus]|uniref:uncharacterized protein isoform X3 n=1 Tax=Panulirus ornatus TaxID=150431 RepID=UPI003A8B07F7
MGTGGEAAAMVIITLLAILGNALVVVTLLRRSLLHHPSNRLVLSLTASNLVLAVVVLPGMVASLMMGSSGNITVPQPLPSLTLQQNQSLDVDLSVLTTPEILHEHQLYTFSDYQLQEQQVDGHRHQEHKKDVSYDVDFKKQGSQNKKSQDDVPQTKDEQLRMKDPWENASMREEVHSLQGKVEEGLEAGQWIGSGILCKMAAFFTNFVTTASAITVAVIALDRYLAIVRPMVYGLMVTGNRCLLMLAWCWVQALFTALPPLLGWARYEHRGPEGHCGVGWASSPSYTAVWVISVFLIPVIIMLVCYYFILQVARNKCRRIHVGTVLGSAMSPVTPDPSSVCLDGPALPNILEPPIEDGSGLTMESVLNHQLENGSSHLVENGSGPTQENRYSQSNGNGSGPPTGQTTTVTQTVDPLVGQGIPCRSRSINGMNKHPQPVRPCLRRAQSSISMRPSTVRKKFSIGGRKPSWSWEASPAKGFRTVCVVVGTHVFTWAPYSALAVAEAVLGQELPSLVPHWARVTSTLLLFMASVFYPIVYGLYNRSIRKEVLACMCPSSSRDRRRGSCHRHASTLHSNTGSVLDFSSLRHRENEEQQQESLMTISPGLLTVPIKTISGTLANRAVTTLSPLLLLAENDALPSRGYNFNARKQSQDSDCCLYELSAALTKRDGQPGAVMGSSDDPDSDMEIPALLLNHHQPTRRVSAPSILDTVREDPHASSVTVQDSSGSRSPTQLKKLPIIPLSAQLLGAGPTMNSSLPRSHSLEKLTSFDSKVQRDILLNDKITTKSLRKKLSLPPVVRETHFNASSSCERVQKRKGSVSVLKVMAIPEDSGILECPEIPDSGRGSVDNGEIVKTRACRQISIDEGIGVECLVEEVGVPD